MRGEFFALMGECVEELDAVERELDYRPGLFQQRLKWKTNDLRTEARLGDMVKLYTMPNVLPDGSVRGKILIIDAPINELDVINALHAKGWKRRDGHASGGPGWDILAYRASEAGRVEVYGYEPWRGIFEPDHPDYHPGRRLFSPPPPQPIPPRNHSRKYAAWREEYDEWERKHREDAW